MNMPIKPNVAILAGGKGTRLSGIDGYTCKPLTLVSGLPILQHQISLCLKYGFTNIALLVHYEADAIANFFGDGSKFGVNLTYFYEKNPRGTAGALLDALSGLDELFLVLYADTFADVNLRKFYEFGSAENCSGALLLHPNDHPNDSDIVSVDDLGNVSGIHPYPRGFEHQYPNLVNAAMYVLKNSELPRDNSIGARIDIAKDLFPLMIADGHVLRGYVTQEYIKDMGTPLRLDKVQRDILNGIPRKLSLDVKRSAVFLDRDGTINEEVNHLKSPDQIKLLPGAAAGIKKLNQSGFLSIVVTNQPVIARGDVSFEGMRSINAKLETLLGESGAYVDKHYLCPHHPDSGFVGEVESLKINCKCRKPETGMIESAITDLSLDRSNSWLVGDATSDILAGNKAGLKTILLRTGFAGRDYKYDATPSFIAADMEEASEWITRGYSDALLTIMPAFLAAKSAKVILVGGASCSGKSTAATLFKELFHLINKKAEVVALDGWLKNASLRHEGAGVLARYEFQDLFSSIQKFRDSCGNTVIHQPRYDRKTKRLLPHQELNLSPNDVMIIEGVPALMDEKLRSLADFTVYVDIDDSLRRKRVVREYEWRGLGLKEILRIIDSRENDEVAYVRHSEVFANFKIEF